MEQYALRESVYSGELVVAADHRCAALHTCRQEHKKPPQQYGLIAFQVSVE
jgi:hypothetical protein